MKVLIHAVLAMHDKQIVREVKDMVKEVNCNGCMTHVQHVHVAWVWYVHEYCGKF